MQSSKFWLPDGFLLLYVQVASNLEGIARARLEKRPRQYQSDAAVHQAYMQATSGGGVQDGDEEPPDAMHAVEAPQPLKRHFELIPWNITDMEDMQKVLEFSHRVRLTPFAKELLKLPCMQVPLQPQPSILEQHEFGSDWRNKYSLAQAPIAEVLKLIELQDSRLPVSHREEDLDLTVDASFGGDATAAIPECFADQTVYARPSAYIAALVAALPPHEQLTRDQYLGQSSAHTLCLL